MITTSAAPLWRVPLAGGDAGILQTLAAMRRDARTFAAVPALRTYARGLAGTASRAAQYQRLRAFLATNTTYADDPADTELIRTGYEQLRRITARGRVAGDCDDVATLSAGLARALGARARFVVLGFDDPGPLAAYAHVYTDMEVAPGVWRDFDLTRTPTTPPATRRWEVTV